MLRLARGGAPSRLRTLVAAGQAEVKEDEDYNNHPELRYPCLALFGWAVRQQRTQRRE